MPIHVRAGAALEGATGSETHPFPSLRDTLMRAPVGSWIVVAPGTYAEPLEIARSLHVHGRCAASVILAPPATPTQPSLSILAGTVDLRGFTVQASRPGIAVAGASATVTLRSVQIVDALWRALDISASARVAAEDLSIRGLGETAAPRRAAVAVTAQGTLTARRMSIAGASAYAIIANGSGSTFDVSDSALTGTRATPTQASGVGAGATFGGAGVLRRVAVDRSEGLGLQTMETQAHLEVEDVWVHGTTSSRTPNTVTAMGIGVSVRSSVTARRLWIDENAEYGIGVLGERARINVMDAIIRRTRSTSTTRRSGVGAAVENPAELVMDAGVGADAATGSELVALRVLLTENEQTGILVNGPSAHVRADSVVIRRSPMPSNAGFGAGAAAVNGARLELGFSVIEDSNYSGLSAIAGATVTLSDSAIRATHQHEPGGGIAIGSYGSTLTLDRVLVGGSDSFGVLTTEGTLTVRSSRITGSGSTALVASDGGVVNIASTEVVGAVGAGITAVDEGTTLTLNDVVVREVQSSTDPNYPVVYRGGVRTGGATLDGHRVRIENCDQIGLNVIGGTALWEDGVITTTRGTAADPKSWGAFIGGGARVTMNRMLFAASSQIGLSAVGSGTVVAYRDGVVEGGAPINGVRRTGGVDAAYGAQLELTRSVLTGATETTVLVAGDGAHADIVDCALIRGRRVATGLSFSNAIAALLSGTVSVRGSWIADNADNAVAVFGLGARVEVTDSLIEAGPDARGAQAGIAVIGNGTASATRCAMRNVGGIGVAVVPGDVAAGDDGGRVTLQDVFIRGVRATRPRVATGTREVAYGLHTSGAGSIEGSHVVLDEGQWGIFRAGGAVTLHEGLIVRQSEAAGANRASGLTGIVLDRVERRSNTSNEVEGEASLPEFHFTPPTPPCREPPCAVP